MDYDSLKFLGTYCNVHLVISNFINFGLISLILSIFANFFKIPFFCSCFAIFHFCLINFSCDSYRLFSSTVFGCCFLLLSKILRCSTELLIRVSLSLAYSASTSTCILFFGDWVTACVCPRNGDMLFFNFILF